jgi:hypothetical protein
VNEVNAMDFFLVWEIASTPVSGVYDLHNINLDGAVNSSDFLTAQENNNELFRSAVPE